MRPIATRSLYIQLTMKSKIFIAIVLLLLLLPARAADDQSAHKKLQIPNNKVGDVIKGVSYKVDQGRSFQLINLPALPKKYLFLSLKADEIYEHLELSLSIYKEGSQTPLHRCLKDEVDSCYLPREILEVNETLLIVVETGGEDCEYELRSYWSDLEHIYAGTEVKFMFSKQQQKQIYHLQLQGKEFQELRIIIKPQTRRYAFDRIKMYGSFGKDSLPSAEKHDFQSHYLWEDAQGIYLSRRELKQLTLNLILQGQIETVYTLMCDLINKTHNDVALNKKIYEYLEKDESYDYHFNFKNKDGELEYDTYALTLAMFTGDLSVELYTDKEKTTRLTLREPFMYMGDVQYLLTKEEITQNMPNGLYVRAISRERVTTFMVQFEGRVKEQIFELHEHIYEFMEVHNSSVSYFKVAKYQQQSQKAQLSDLKVVFTLIQVMGRVAVQFRKCTTTKEECTSDKYLAHTAKIESEYRSVGTKNTYTLTLASDFWSNVNMVEKNAVILVVLTNQQKNVSFTATEFSVGNRPEFLRQSKPIESHVLKNELKIYKFVNTDPNIAKIKLHINKISGCFNTFVFRHEPSEDELTKDLNKVSGPIYETSERLTDEPLVIVIRGEDSATFSLVVQSVHKDQNKWNFITLSEDVEFKIKIAPNKYEIFEVIPILSKLFFSYKATGAVHACMLTDGVCEDKQANFTNEGEIIEDPFFERVAYIKLRNPSPTKTVQLTTIFHSSTQSHCQSKKIGQLYTEVVKEGSCFITTIDSAQQFQVLIIREQVGDLSYTMALCDRLLNFAIKEDGEQRYIISAEQIKVNCQGHSQYTFMFVAGGKKQADKVSPNKLHLKYLVDFTSSKIILPDGVGYHGTEITTEEPVKKFAYPLLNKIDTSIILSTEKRLYFLVKVIDAAKRDSQSVSINSNDFSSQSEKFYYLQSIYLKISAEELKKFSCQDCELLIYVYSKEDVGTIVDFTVEATQNFVNLEEGVPKSGYLVQNSKAYYGFKIKQAGSLLVEVTDNNRDCTEIYVSSLEYPDEKRHLAKSFDGQLIVDVASADKSYYITVKARKNCAYTITAALTQGKSHIVKLERGVLGYCNLVEDETKLYTFKHLSEKAFKVISLHKYGQVEFYLNKTTPARILQLVKEQKVDLDSFSYRSDFKNRLILDKNDKEFCKGCLYVLAVHAKKHTESSIFLGDEDTKIPISEEKVLNDILPKQNMVTRGQFYFYQKGILEVKVHSGKLQVEILYKQQSVKVTFPKNKQLVAYNFTLQEEKKFYDPVTVIYKALEDNTIYSSRVKPASMTQTTSDGTSHLIIDPNEPNYLFLTKGELSCAVGYLKRADERLFISFNSDDRETAKNMKIVGKLNSNYTRISQDTTKNVISITFIDAASQILKEAITYELCLEHETQSMSLTIMQSEETSLLPQNLETLVVAKQTYDIYPEGDFLLDIYECRGTAKISYGSNKKALEASKPRVLDMIGMPDQPHAVRLQQGFSNLLLSVQSELSLIRWIHIDEDQEKGLGYYLFRVGNLKYNSAFGEIEFLVDPVKRVKKSKTKIEKVRYNLYVSNSEEDLKYASQCEKYLPGSVIDYNFIHSAATENQFKFTIHKNKLMEKYAKAENLFFNVVADLTLKTPDASLESYRFIYKSQELPAEVFTPSQLQKYDLTIVVVVLVLFIFALLTCAWLFTKIIVPLIGRLRNRLLVEENGLETSKDKNEEFKEQQIEVPPSSDRQGMNLEDQVETEQKM